MTGHPKSIRHLIRGAAVSVAVAGVALMATTSPASATVLETDYPMIWDTNVQFGSLPSPFDMQQGYLRPGGPGVLEWDVTNGTVTPRLIGEMHTTNIGGRCAKMRIYYYELDSNGDYRRITAKSSTPFCPIDDQWRVTGVNIAPFSDPDIAKVIVTTTLEDSNGTFVNLLAQEFFLGD